MEIRQGGQPGAGRDHHDRRGIAARNLLYLPRPGDQYHQLAPSAGESKFRQAWRKLAQGKPQKEIQPRNKRSQGAADCGKRDGDAYFTYARRPDRRKMRCPVSAYGMAASSSAVIFRTKIWWLALSK